MADDVSLSKLSADLELRPPSLRERIAGRVLTLFSVSLFATLGLVALLSLGDFIMIWRGIIEPADRLVTQPVLMSMIAATIVELGAALTTIVIAVFKTPKKPPQDEAAGDNGDLQISETPRDLA